jgi:signal transduction histidine kinase
MRTARQEVRTDPVLLRRMIGNIISNAVKFTPEGKKVLIAARARTTCTWVEVWDQGPGIASDELSKVFLEFYKIEGPSKSAEGFGLGLSIVARLAHALDVHVNVRSRLGSGTVFRLVVDHGPQRHGRRQNV